MAQKKIAPGKPGVTPQWTSSQKTGVGTSVEMNSRIWFTISHGIINEVYYPTVDIPNTRDCQLIVTDGKTFFSEEKRDCNSVTKNIKPGVGGYEIINTHKKGFYKIKKRIYCNPYNSTLIQEVEFIPLVKKDFRVFSLLAPHMNSKGKSNSGYIKNYKGENFLTATRINNYHIVMGCSRPFKALSCGYVGTSDGYLELKKNKFLKNIYTQATKGTISLTAEVDLNASKKFSLLLSFGHSFEEAAKTCRATLFHNMNHLLKKFVEGWEKTIHKQPKLSFINKEAKSLYESSIMVLNTHLGKVAPGNVIASLSIPWGSHKGDDDLGGYHLIWPRDLVEISGGFIASGDAETARLILHFLASIQEGDGHFAQCLWHTGKPYWNNIQMDETALPIILAGTLRDKKALKWLDPWPMVSKAIQYLIKNGPVTLQDRWEEDGGYTAFTLACEISALLIGADFYEDRGLKKEAQYLREIADYWNANIEKWTYVENTQLSKKHKIDGYYVRITPDDLNPNNSNEIIEVKNRPADHTFKAASEIISCDSLALVRFGLRSADDPKILNTVKVIDALLKEDTKCGPVWKRYNEDGYGEHENGDCFDGTGIGRGWPLITAERAHYEIANGNHKKAIELLKAVIKQAGENYLIPEQIWDDKDIPKKFLFNGKPTLGAMPLVWAHAEYLKLVRSLNDKKVYDCPKQTLKRYCGKKPNTHLQIWKPNHRIKDLDPSKTLRIEVFEPCTILYTIGTKKAEDQMKDSNLGLYYIDIKPNTWRKNHKIQFRFANHSKFKKKSFTIRVQS